MDRIITKRGLELLKQRTIFPAELPELAVKLPPVTSVFFKYYNTGEYEEMLGQGEYVSLPNVSRCWIAFNVWFENLEFNGIKYKDSFQRILPCNEILNEYSLYSQKYEVWHNEGFIKLGYMANWDVILLGIEEYNLDEIWVQGEAIAPGKPHRFANNIFEFMSNVYQYFTDEDLVDYTKGKITGDQLYKNWKEDFWRIRE